MKISRIMMGLALAALPAMCTTIIPNGSWYSFQWNGPVGTFSFGSNQLNYQAAPNFTPVVGQTLSPWTFSGPAVVTVTDLFSPGDQFAIYDNSTLFLTTSSPTQTGVNCGGDPLNCIGATGISHGTSGILGAGSHSLTIQLIGEVDGITSGIGAFSVGTVVVPEPTTLSLIGLGLVGLAFRWRAKRS